MMPISVSLDLDLSTLSKTFLQELGIIGLVFIFLGPYIGHI